jgi:hypothetical protein
MPFHGEAKAGNVNGVPGRDEEDAALVVKFYSESKRDFGIKVISPHDMALAFAAYGQPVPILEPVESAATAGKSRPAFLSRLRIASSRQVVACGVVASIGPKRPCCALSGRG